MKAVYSCSKINYIVPIRRSKTTLAAEA